MKQPRQIEPRLREMRTLLTCVWPLVAKADVSSEGAEGGDYLLNGVVGAQRAVEKRWTLPLHVRFVNLPIETVSGLIQTSAARDFTKKYGVVRWHPEEATDGSEFKPHDSFSIRSNELAKAQALLRQAWEKPTDAVLRTIEAQGLRALGVRLSAEWGVEVVVSDLWSFICLLFLHDYAANRLGKCPNPNCRAPYFIKKRTTQKLCESRECADWAQRRYALDWWHSNQKLNAKLMRRRRR